MKKVLFLTVLALSLLTAYSHAEMEGHMMGHSMMGGSGLEEGMSDERMTHPCMMGYGMMGCGMMGPCGMTGCGMMEGCGMMGHGMMGRGMTGGHGMMGCGMGPGMWGYGYQQKAFQKFLNETKDLRKELHNMKFEYFEAVRNPDTKPEDVEKLEKDMKELQKKIYEKMGK